ncbi:tyrosine protein phosphatase [Solwaraspora sp. WMMD791]|uniref:protein-tyrosine phosphatase family protein n=1 Tax=Solwaraspora sp. WMMD791 TaxID=3016086 RepID=UPI00249CA79A|nr:dual specificity protein phosphatase family protein [Solwaraspora sp. WMMD791]WFE28186.1 tyrosine protein phosphatase [Solwaraspora sp. WMMD791]
MPAPNRYPIPAPPPARLSILARPRGGDWLDDELSAARTAGVDVLVSLLTSAERDELDLADEPAAAIRAGLEFHAFEIADLGVPDPHAIRPLLDLLATELRAGRHVAVHCRAGIGRSSLITVALLTRLGVDTEQAWNVIAHARGVPVPETAQQRRWPSADRHAGRGQIGN